MSQFLQPDIWPRVVLTKAMADMCQFFNYDAAALVLISEAGDVAKLVSFWYVKSVVLTVTVCIT